MKKLIIILLLCCLISPAVLAGDPKNPGYEYKPIIIPEDFSSVINNPYFPLIPGTVTIHEGQTDEGTEVIIVEVKHTTRTVMGISCVVVRDRVWANGKLVEDTDDWYAQDKEGNVWYMGEVSKEYEDGEIVSYAGSWEAGVDGAIPGIIVHREPRIGVPYYQEYWEGEAEDMAEAVMLGVTVNTPYGIYENCLKLKEWNPLERGSREYKYFAPGKGVVLEESGSERIYRVKNISENEVDAAVLEVENREYDIPLGIKMIITAAVEDVTGDAAFLLIPGLEWEIPGSGFTLGLEWEAPLAPDVEAGVLTIFEEYEYEFEEAGILLFGGNENSLEMEVIDESEGLFYIGVEFYEILGFELNTLYMPEWELGSQISLGYEFEFTGRGILTMEAAQNFSLYEDLKPGDFETDVNYAYPFGALTLTAGLEAVVEMESEEGDNDPALFLSPYLMGSYSF